ncbi:hypothetical protein TNCV_4231931, partial [Trichonephila clavipes]
CDLLRLIPRPVTRLAPPVSSLFFFGGSIRWGVREADTEQHTWRRKREGRAERSSELGADANREELAGKRAEQNLSRAESKCDGGISETW